MFVSSVFKSPLRSGLLQGGILQASADIGATGAATVDAQSDAGITISRSSTGTYSVMFPIGRVVRVPKVTFKSTNIVVARVTAFDAAAGTATVVCYSDAGSTAADPASGNVLALEFLAARHAKAT